MSTATVPLTTEQKIAEAAQVADAVLQPLSGANDNSAAAVGISAGVETAGKIAEIAEPQYAAEIQLAESLEPVAYHAGLAIAHLLQHLFHHTKSVPTK